MLTIEIFIDLSGRHVRDIAWQKVLGQISQRVEIADAEALGDTVLLTVRELVEHRAQVGHLEMVGQLGVVLLVFLGVLLVVVVGRGAYVGDAGRVLFVDLADLVA